MISLSRCMGGHGQGPTSKSVLKTKAGQATQKSEGLLHRNTGAYKGIINRTLLLQ